MSLQGVGFELISPFHGMSSGFDVVIIENLKLSFRPHAPSRLNRAVFDSISLLDFFSTFLPKNNSACMDLPTSSQIPLIFLRTTASSVAALCAVASRPSLM